MIRHAQVPSYWLPQRGLSFSNFVIPVTYRAGPFLSELHQPCCLIGKYLLLQRLVAALLGMVIWRNADRGEHDVW